MITPNHTASNGAKVVTDDQCSYCGKTRSDHWMNATPHEPIIASEIIDWLLVEQPSEMTLLYRRLLTPNKTLRERLTAPKP